MVSECQLYMKAGHYLVHKPTLELRDIPLFNALFLHTTSPQVCTYILRPRSFIIVRSKNYCIGGETTWEAN